MEERLHNHQEAAQYLNIKTQTLYNWRHRRRGPNYVLIGAKPMYRAQDLKEYVNDRRIILDDGEGEVVKAHFPGKGGTENDS